MVGSPFSPFSLYRDSELAVIAALLLGRLNVDSLLDVFLSGTLVGVAVSLDSITVVVVFLILREDDELLLSLFSVVFDDSFCVVESFCFLCEKSLEKALPRLSLL